MSIYTDASAQTDENLIYNYAWQKYYHHFYQNSVNNSVEEKNTNYKNNVNSLENEIDSIDLTENQKNTYQTCETNEFVYELKNGIYFDMKNALYFDTEKQLYFDKENKIYYQYQINKQLGTYHLRYHSIVSNRDWKILSRKLQLPIEESGEIGMSVSELNKWEHDEFENEDDIEDLTSKYPPCMRAILIESNESDLTEKLGSLFLVPYTGGMIGRDIKSNLINFKNDFQIEKAHTYIGYDLSKKEYYAEDRNTKTGTFLNEIPIEPNKRFSITHNDKLKIGNNTLLLHVHAGVTTCLDCEPGHVMKKYEKIKFNEKLDTVNIEISRREINREMKKKYGLKWNNFDKPTGGAIELSEDSKKNKYLDRSKLRRDEAGIDYSHIMDKNEPTTASVQSSITNGNIGFKLLKNMGWNEGKGLGKHESGILEPVNAKMRITSSGLGFEASELNMDVSHEQKNKHINWNKTKNRYNLINTSSNLSNVFNIESDTED